MKLAHRARDVDAHDRVAIWTGTGERIDEIRTDRQNYVRTVIAKKLRPKPTDVVLDLGSGCGYCADLSPNFADFCKQETQLYGVGIIKAFAHAVFIHVSLFEAVLYFRELALILPPGGLLLIDINGLDHIDTAANKDLNRHLQYCKSDRNNIFDLMQWHSNPSYARVAAVEGFDLVESAPSKTTASLLFHRRKH